MQKQMKGYVGLMAIAALAWLNTGCATRLGVGAPATPATQDHVAAQQDNQLLNVMVKCSTTSQNAAAVVAGRVRDAVEGALAPSVKINPQMTDILVDLQVNATLFDKSGDFSLYRGEVQAVVTRMFDGKVLGRNTWVEKGARQLGDAEACRAVADVLAKQAAPWVARTIEPASQGLAAADVRLAAPFYRRTQTQAAYAAQFVETVKKLDGIVSCVLVQQDLAANQMTFRVVYFKEKFPEGLLNRLTLQQDLDLKPR